MKKARLFTDKDIVVLADEVLSGKYNRNDEFVDIEEDFRVTFVKAAKNNGGPYFRLYVSLEDYNSWSDEKKSRYEYVKEMRYHGESDWHLHWKKMFRKYGNVEEKYFKAFDYENKRGKFADSYCPATNTVIEFQHSFIENDFVERNSFYDRHNINLIWLFDLTENNIKKQGENKYEILENNSLGFFRITGNEDNLKKHPIFIQMNDKMIYGVSKLLRKEIDNNLKSTIRYFYTNEVYTENEFVEAVVNNRIKNEEEKNNAEIINKEIVEYLNNLIMKKEENKESSNVLNDLSTVPINIVNKVNNYNNQYNNKKYAKSIYALCYNSYYRQSLVIENVYTGERIKIYKSNGKLWESENGEIVYRKLNEDNTIKDTNYYYLPKSDAYAKKWKKIFAN